jgi:hypothetical protein
MPRFARNGAGMVIAFFFVIARNFLVIARNEAIHGLPRC